MNELAIIFERLGIIERGINPIGASIRVLGLTVKEDVTDLRNSKVPDLIAELSAFGAHVDVVDPHADPDEAMRGYGLTLADSGALPPAHAVVLASPHRAFLDDAATHVIGALAEGGVVIDVKAKPPRDPRVWAL